MRPCADALPRAMPCQRTAAGRCASAGAGRKWRESSNTARSPGGSRAGDSPELRKEGRRDCAVGRRGRRSPGEAGHGGGIAGFAQQGDIKALRVGGVLVHPERAFAAGELRRGENEAGERLQRDRLKAELFNGKTDLPLVLVHIGCAG